MAAFGIKAIQPDDNTHILGFATARSTADDSLLEVWNGPTSADLVYTLDKDGQHQSAAGTASRPTYSWEDSKTTGWYRIGADNIGFAIATTKLLDLASTAFAVTGAISATTTGTFGGILAVTDATEATSTTAASMKTAGGIAWVKDAYVGDDMFFTSGAVLDFNSADMTVTHSANTLTVAGGTWATAALTASTGVFSGILKTDDVTDATSGTDGSLQTDGGLSVAKAAWIGTTVTADAYLASANDSGALGASGTAFSDLFLASGAVINFNAGDVTLTHSANTLAIAGGAVTMDSTLAVTGNTTASGHIFLAATKGLYLDGGGNTLIQETSADVLAFVVGGTTLLTLTESTTDTFAVAADSFTVSGAGPHAIGAATSNNIMFNVAGSFTSGGIADDTVGLFSNIALTVASGDTDIVAQMATGGTVATQADEESISVVTGLRVREPVITDNLGGAGVITIASTIYVQDAPTEGVTNAAIYVSAGATMLPFANTVSGTGLMVTTNDTSVQEIMRDSSSARFKEEIVDMDVDVRAALAIKPKEYGRPGAIGRVGGFIVEDFHDAGFRSIIAYDGDKPAGFLEFGRGVTALHQAVLRHHDDRIETNEQKIKRLEAEVRKLKEAA